jgi:hypothetical protein
MNLAVEDARLFFKLFFALLAYANRQLKVLPNVTTPADIPKAGSQKVVTIRDALYAHSELLDQFVRASPLHLFDLARRALGEDAHRVNHFGETRIV